MINDAHFAQKLKEEINANLELRREVRNLRALKKTLDSNEALREEKRCLMLMLGSAVYDQHVLDFQAIGPRYFEYCLSPIEKSNGIRAQEVKVIEGPVSVEDAVSRLKQTWAARFYINYLKRYHTVRQIVRLVWPHLYPFYVRYLDGLFFGTSKKKSFGVIKLGDLQKRRSLVSYEVFDVEQIEILQPKVYPVTDRNSLGSFVDQYAFPAIFVVSIDDAMVLGGTNLMVMGDWVVCHDLYNFKHDYTSEEMHGRILHDIVGESVQWLSHDDAPESVRVCATFVDACAVNYAHWLTEVLPRIALFCGDKRFEGVPIVVNDGLPKNIMESLFLVKGDGREVITLPTGRALAVENLYVVSATGYVPFEPRKGNMRQSRRRGEFSSRALYALRNRVDKLCVGSGEGMWPDRIYLRRNSGVRKLTNTVALEKLLFAYGFVIVEPEKLAFHQQAQLFMNAKVVVGATGAAFANTIFCPAGAQVAIMVAKHKDLAYEYWVNMLMPLGINVSYILGRSKESTIHSDFEIDPAHLTEFLDSLGEK